MTTFPGYALPAELIALREQIRRIVRDELLPIEQRIDPDAAEIPEEDYRRLAAKTKAAGLWCLGAPEQYGGGGLDTFSMSVLLEEMSQHRMGLYNAGCGVFGRYPPPVIYGGTREQIEKYAVPALRDGFRTFFAITEPSGGSDPANAIRSRGVKQGSHWVLNGTKTFISHAHEAEWGVVFVRTDAAKGRAGISCFIIDKGTPGFTAKPIRTIRTVAVPNEVVLEDCRVPAENLLGEEGRGLHLCLDLLTRLRFPYSACNLGVAVAAHRMAVAHAKQRETFGVPLSQRQAIQWMLADAEVELRATRWLDLGGRVEGRPRRGRAGRGLDRQAVLERGARARGRQGRPDPRRLRRLQGVPPRAVVPRGACPPDRRRPVRGAPHGHRPIPLQVNPTFR